MSEYKIYLSCCTQVLLQDIGIKQFKQRDIASTYAQAMRTHHAGIETVDWTTVNLAIIGRWSRSGLERVKRRAHDILAGKIEP